MLTGAESAAKRRYLELLVTQLEIVNGVKGFFSVQIEFETHRIVTAPIKIETSEIQKYPSGPEIAAFETFIPIQNKSMTITLRHQGLSVGQLHFPFRNMELPFMDSVPIHNNERQLVGRVTVKMRLLVPESQPKNYLQSVTQPTAATSRNFYDTLVKGYIPIIGNLIGETSPTINPEPSNQIAGEQPPPPPEKEEDKTTVSNSVEFKKSVAPSYNPRIEKYRSKCYIFGDDSFPVIVEFDFITEKFRTLPVPYNLTLMGYSIATALPNGKIILTGGINKSLNIIVSTCYWYDPVTNTAKILEELNQARYTHTVAVLEDYLYVAGGRYYGKDKEGVLPSCERYNLITNKWENIAPLNKKRCTAASFVHSGLIYVMGGYHGTGRLNCIEQYNPTTNTWIEISLKMPESIEAGFSFPIGDGKAVYIAGKDDNKANSDVNMYDFEAMTVKHVGNLTMGRILARSTKYKDTIYVFGGQTHTWEKGSIHDWKFTKGGSFETIINSEMKLYSCAATRDYFDEDHKKQQPHELFHMFRMDNTHFTLKWDGTSSAPDANQPPQPEGGVSDPPKGDSQISIVQPQQIDHPHRDFKFRHGCKIAPMPNGAILILGGSSCNRKVAYNHAIIHIPKGNKYFNAEPMYLARYDFGVAEVMGVVYAIGGFTAGDAATRRCERYDIRANRWEDLPSMTTPRANPIVVPYRHKIYVLGGVQGQGSNLTPVLSVEVYDIATDEWTVVNDLKLPFPTTEFFGIPLSYTNEAILFFDKTFTRFGVIDLEKPTEVNEKVLVENGIIPVGDNTDAMPSGLVIDEAYNIIGQWNPDPSTIQPTFDPSLTQVLLFCPAKSKPEHHDIYRVILKQQPRENNSSTIMFKCTKFKHLTTFHTTVSSSDQSGGVTNSSGVVGSFTYPYTNYSGYSDDILYGADNERGQIMFAFLNDSASGPKILKYDCKLGNFDMVEEVPADLQVNKHGAAVGIPDGSVLITGGVSTKIQFNATVVGDAYVYSAASNTVKQIKSMISPRYGHVMIYTRGYVYALGGRELYNNSPMGALRSCERLQIGGAMAWESIASLNTPRYNHAAALQGQYIYVFGGNNGSALLNSIERYSLKTTQFEAINDLRLPSGLEFPVAITVSYNEVYVLGGYQQDETMTEEVVSFDFVTKKMTKRPPMLHKRKGCQAFMYYNDLFVFGGNSLSSCERLTLVSTPGKEAKWRLFPSYSCLLPPSVGDLRDWPVGISRLHLDSHNIFDVQEFYRGGELKSFYVFGTEQFPKILKLDIPNLQWTEIAKPEGLQLWDYSIALTIPSGKIFLSGGINTSLNNIKQSAYLIDVQGSVPKVETLPLMTHGRYTHTVCYLNKYIYAMGGRYYGSGIAGVLTHCERYSIDDEKWTAIAPLRNKRCTAQSTSYSNRVYIFGGYRGDGRVKSIERYNEISNVWEIIPFLLHFPIEAEAMVPISNKELVLIGGKDDFSEQAYVTLYDLERQVARQEKPMTTSRILLKCAKYNNTIYVMGGDKNNSCEKTTIGEWAWGSFVSYSSLLANNLQKAAYAQSF